MTYEEEQRHLLRIGQRAVSDNMYRMADALVRGLKIGEHFGVSP